ncbi:MAG: MGMT family protein [Elusimicrobia bacterium]|nr:MGMT family protein [Elusimicrobiota bacterium]
MSKHRKTKKDNTKHRVMQAISEIPFGKTISYSQLAKNIGEKGKTRYIASFLKLNAYPIAIPCHRVIKKDGDYGNYALGKELKKYLIEWEKKLIKP